MVIAGDGAGMVNVPTLKGVHYAMHAGMYAAEAIVAAL
jgi:electron-transferring-flavoprotein dehydrogenase